METVKQSSTYLALEDSKRFKLDYFTLVKYRDDYITENNHKIEALRDKIKIIQCETDDLLRQKSELVERYGRIDTQIAILTRQLENENTESERRDIMTRASNASALLERLIKENPSLAESILAKLTDQ